MLVGGGCKAKAISTFVKVVLLGTMSLKRRKYFRRSMLTCINTLRKIKFLSINIRLKLLNEY